MNSVLGDKVTAEEASSIGSLLLNSRSDSLEFEQLANFLLNKFSAKRDIVSLYVKTIASYLDKNEGNKTTEEFFKANKLVKAGMYDKLTFTKKLVQIFGFTPKHADDFFDVFKDEETELIALTSFVNAIDACRTV